MALDPSVVEGAWSGSLGGSGDRDSASCSLVDGSMTSL